MRDFKVGDTVYSIYDDMRGKVVEVLEDEEYRIKWRDGLVSNAFIEEVYR